MELLFKAYACENQPDGTKLLLPGVPVKPHHRYFKAGASLLIELADGTKLHTVVVDPLILCLDENAADRLRAKPDFYEAVKVPGDFSAPGIELGANVSVGG
jgi:hypothetical protein